MFVFDVVDTLMPAAGVNRTRSKSWTEFVLQTLQVDLFLLFSSWTNTVWKFLRSCNRFNYKDSLLDYRSLVDKFCESAVCSYNHWSLSSLVAFNGFVPFLVHQRLQQVVFFFELIVINWDWHRWVTFHRLLRIRQILWTSSNYPVLNTVTSVESLVCDFNCW